MLVYLSCTQTHCTICVIFKQMCASAEQIIDIQNSGMVQFSVVERAGTADAQVQQKM